MRMLYWVTTAVIAVILALFAVSNREAVAVGFWPMPYLLELPLYLIILLAVLLGFVLGEFAAWVSARHWRREVRRRGRRIDALERELAATQSRLQESAPAPRTGLPARG
ncbi:MAG: DUF1049 domain-containing protein [Alphaproteobacteria bacterium]|nr:DUF1049 domain-containing protein [Alphaproteobacteria bacterium]